MKIIRIEPPEEFKPIVITLENKSDCSSLYEGISTLTWYLGDGISYDAKSLADKLQSELRRYLE